MLVSVYGYVTALDTYGFYMQDGTTAALHTGLYVYVGSSQWSGYDSSWLDNRSVGEYVMVTALVDEYYSLTELNLRTSDAPYIISMSTGNTLTPLVTTTGAIGTSCTASGEAHEGILVTVVDVTLTSEANSYGEVSMDDGSGETQLEDSILDSDSYLEDLLGSTLTGQTLSSVTGVVRCAYVPWAPAAG